MVAQFKVWLGKIYACTFLAIALAFGGLALVEFVEAFLTNSLVDGLVRAFNDALIALASFELGIGIGHEYGQSKGPRSLLLEVTRTVTRFVGVACIALVLEGLILVIKYSQLQLAGNLMYPVAIIGSAAGLLMSLGGFLRLAHPLISDPAAKALETERTGSTRRNVATYKEDDRMEA